MARADPEPTLGANEAERRCILVVEDELIVRWAICESLRDAGYKVIEAVTGDEALSIIESDIHLDLVFSDVRMPGAVDGLALLDRVRKTRPDVPFIITSGHCDLALALDRGAAQFVRKPYGSTVLLRAVDGQLGRADRLSWSHGDMVLSS